MKGLLVFAFALAVVFAEPPRNNGKFRGVLRPPFARQVAPTYGPPAPPKPSYGPPPETTPIDITTEADAETITDQPQRFSARPQKQQKKIVNQGQYYLLIDNGRRLQRVIYVTEEDLKRMELNAKLTYRDVEPITGPIYNADLIDAPFIPFSTN